MSLDINIQLQRNGFSLHFEGRLTCGATGLFGPSGAGKTTLLHCIAGLTRPDSGKIVLNKTTLYDSASHHHLPPWKRQIGLVFQDHLLFPHMTVESNLAFGQKGPRRERKTPLCEVAELLEIHTLLKRKVTALSGGQKQRVALGRAILASPGLLLLDEPFTGLDRGLKQQLIPYLKRLYEKTHTPMILVSHNPEDMVELVDEMFFLENGKLFAQGALHPSQEWRSPGRFCGTENPHDFRTMRNHLIRNHTLRFPGTGSRKREGESNIRTGELEKQTECHWQTG